MPSGSSADGPQGRVRRWLGQIDALAVAVLALVALVAVVAVPLASKSDGLYSQWLFAFQGGPVKRGLVGTVVHALVVTEDQVEVIDLVRAANVVAIANLVSWTAVCARVWIARRPRWRSRPDGGWADPSMHLVAITAVLLLASPIGVMWYVSNPANLEVVSLLVLSLFVHLALWRPGTAVLLGAGAATAVVATMVHESALLSVVPIVLLVCWLRSGGSRSPRVLAPLLAVYLVCGALSVATSVHSSEVADDVVARAEEVYPTYEANRVESTAVLTRSITENVEYAFDKYRSFSGGGSRVVLSLVVTAPAMAFLAEVVRRRLPAGQRLPATVLPLLPVLLVVLADDVYRWYILVVIGFATVALLGEAEDEPSGAAPIAPSLVAFGLLAVLVACLLPYPYFLSGEGNPMSDELQRLLSNLRSVVA